MRFLYYNVLLVTIIVFISTSERSRFVINIRTYNIFINVLFRARAETDFVLTCAILCRRLIYLHGWHSMTSSCLLVIFAMPLLNYASRHLLYLSY